MSDEVYDGAIGIDLGMSHALLTLAARRADSLYRHHLLLRCQL